MTVPWPRYRQDKDWELSVVGVLSIAGVEPAGKAPVDQKPHRKYATVMVLSDTPERWPVCLADVTVAFDERSVPRKFARSVRRSFQHAGKWWYRVPGRPVATGFSTTREGRSPLSFTHSPFEVSHAPPWSGGTGPWIL